jgi:hypothetical protein
LEKVFNKFRGLYKPIHVMAGFLLIYCIIITTKGRTHDNESPYGRLALIPAIRRVGWYKSIIAFDIP